MLTFVQYACLALASLVFLVVTLGSVVNQATMGVALIGSACFLAIVARIAQASRHHQELMGGTATETKPQRKNLKEMIG